MSSSIFVKHYTRPNPEASQSLTKFDFSEELHCAVRRADVNRLNFVLSQCSDEVSDSIINAQDAKTGMTPLSTAVSRGHRDFTLYLLSIGADINGVDSLQWTPLHWAVHTGSVELVSHLIRAGAKPTDGKPTTVMQLAIDQKFGLVDMFIEKASVAGTGTQTQKKPLANPNQLEQMRQLVQRARISNLPQDVDLLYSSISPSLNPNQINIWNMPSVLQSPQQCVEFALKTLKETPISTQFGASINDSAEDLQDDDFLFASDSSDDDDDDDNGE